MDLTSDELALTRRRLAPTIHRTPVMTSRALDDRSGKAVFLKCENFQRTGSFKIRGAANFISQLSPEELDRGVVTHSSGNHAQAVALAARLFRTRARIVMPSSAPIVKSKATAEYGGVITLCDPTVEARERMASNIIAMHGSTLVHPYDDERIIAGQATAAAELLEECPEIDTILAPVSGGGLISGTALAAHAHNPAIRVIGCEPELADDAFCSMREGRLVKKPAGATIADGLRANLCDRTFSVISEHVEEILLVSEEQITEAMQFIWQRAKIVIEPSSAAAIAPLLLAADRLAGARVGVIVSGGNVDFRVTS